MIKRYCDFCNSEIVDSNQFEVEGLKGHLKMGKVEVNTILAVDTTTNQPDCCKYCIIDSVKSMDDRPKGRL